ncbi:MAG: CinA family protein [Nitrospiraceae bacterium]|nr:CinA family protein [Nitrospiraceae bacterium]
MNMEKEDPSACLHGDVFLFSAGFPDDALDVVAGVHSFFKKTGLKLSVAESCTGGLIGHYITQLPGASCFFEAGVISYSERAKEKVLHVPEEVVRASGLVSEETAREMARGAMELLGSDFALSTTGNLGPDALEGKAVGLVYVGVCSKRRAGDPGQKPVCQTKKMLLKGGRDENKKEAALEALRFLLEQARNRS